MMRITHLGPAVVVASTLVATLIAGPGLVRSVVRADAEVEALQAAARLEAGNILEAISDAQKDVASVVEPSVVHVSAAGSVAGSRGYSMAATGSGWIWDADGHIVTNAHVVDVADRIEVQLFDGEVRGGKVIGRDLRSDIAVIKIDGGGLVPARRGDSYSVRQGQMVFAFGSPFDFRFSMSGGIVSGLGRSAGLVDIDYENFIQVDAAINPGNSGGPLTDVHGRVVGMNTAIATGRGSTIGQGQFAGIGLAIPMSQIRTVVEQVIESGEIRKGFLGVGLMEADQIARAAGDRNLFRNYSFSPRLIELSKAIQTSYDGEGIVITRLEKGYPAERGGILEGDIVESVDGRRVRGVEQLRSMIASTRPGQAIVLGIRRFDDSTGDFEPVALEIVLGELDLLMASLIGGPLRALGFRELETMTEERARAGGIEFRRGVRLTEVAPGSRLARVFPSGTIIVEVDGRGVAYGDELLTRIERAWLAEEGAMLVGVLPSGDVERLELEFPRRR